jgi:hypothetical protein
MLPSWAGCTSSDSSDEATQAASSSQRAVAVRLESGAKAASTTAALEVGEDGGDPVDPTSTGAGTVHVATAVGFEPIGPEYPVSPRTSEERLRAKLVSLGADRPGVRLIVAMITELRAVPTAEPPGIETCVKATGLDGAAAYPDCAFFPGSLASEHYARTPTTLVLEVGQTYILGLEQSRILGAAVATPDGAIYLQRDERVAAEVWRIAAAELGAGQ